jgi:hypothetical protein
MATEAHCPAGDCPSIGVDATPLDPFASVETDSAEMLIYDQGNEDAWIQSDVYYPREACV